MSVDQAVIAALDAAVTVAKSDGATVTIPCAQWDRLVLAIRPPKRDGPLAALLTTGAGP